MLGTFSPEVQKRTDAIDTSFTTDFFAVCFAYYFFYFVVFFFVPFAGCVDRFFF